jgi:hypothetical protein
MHSNCISMSISERLGSKTNLTGIKTNEIAVGVSISMETSPLTNKNPHL